MGRQGGNGNGLNQGTTDKAAAHQLPALILDNWHKPLVFVDCDHVIRYMNRPAREHYAKWRDVIGKSIFDCHNQASRAVIERCFRELQAGNVEALFTDNERYRIYMRRVTDEAGTMLGYHERYAAPLVHSIVLTEKTGD